MLFAAVYKEVFENLVYVKMENRHCHDKSSLTKDRLVPMSEYFASSLCHFNFFFFFNSIPIPFQLSIWRLLYQTPPLTKLQIPNTSNRSGKYASESMYIQRLQYVACCMTQYVSSHVHPHNGVIIII